MGTLQAIERLDLSSRSLTTFLVVSCGVLPMLLFTLLYKTLELNLLETPAGAAEFLAKKGIQQAGMSQNVSSTVGLKNYSTPVLKMSAGQELMDGPVAPGPEQNATKQVLVGSLQNVTSTVDSNNYPTSLSKDVSSQPTTMSAGDQLLGGLLAPGFDEGSCLSRYQSYMYHKNSHKPSLYLISKLRNYESLQRKCRSPRIKSSNRIRKDQLRKKSVHSINDSAVCNYIVWLPVNGLGNRIVSIASTFLYAVLTDRVLLDDFRTAMRGLFCEPFPNASWLLPTDFRQKIDELNLHQDYEVFLNGQAARNLTAFSRPFLFLNLQHGPGDQDRLFHCDHIQAVLQKVPTLILRSDQYFAPYLFMIPAFQAELNKMFPEKETIFHHLGRCLFHPSNEAWGLITKFYRAHFAEADQRVGLQIRVFNGRIPHQPIMNQILSCTLKHKLLPEVGRKTETVSSPSRNRTFLSVLVASLSPEYSKNLTAMYSTLPTMTGQMVRVYQPSHERKQKTNDNTHNMKAWAEMYLLSLCDVLVTSGRSTFGYVAQSLGGLKPWILSKPRP